MIFDTIELEKKSNCNFAIPLRDQALLRVIGRGNPAAGMRALLKGMRHRIEKVYGEEADQLQKKLDEKNKKGE